jgi:hypothetical protein
MAGNERGQALIEFAIIAIVLLMFSAGLLDVGRGFYQYNAVASAARYGARYAGIVGGTCSDTYRQPTGNDWCNQGNIASPPGPPAGCATPPTGAPAFWTSNGSSPCQAIGVSCPSTLDTSFSGYYTASNFVGSLYPSIVGMVVTRFDTNSGSSNVIGAAITPGFDLSKMKVCIQLSLDPETGQWSYKPGAKVTVFVYYPFSAVGPLFGNAKFNLVASSQYTVE